MDIVTDVYTHFGMKDDPFVGTINPEMIFKSAEHLDAAFKMDLWLSLRRGVFLLHGERGCGKTSLMQQVCGHWTVGREPDEEPVSLAYIPVHLGITPEEILKSLMAQFNILTKTLTPKRHTSAIMLETVHEWLIAHDKQDQEGQHHIAVLVLDGAEKLDTVCFDLIESLMARELRETFPYGEILQVFLVAPPDIEARLADNPGFSARISGAAHIGRLSFEESMQLLTQRIEAARGTLDKAFDLTVRQAMHEATGGVARDLCQLADAVLYAAYRQNNHSGSAGLPAFDRALVDMQFKGWKKPGSG